jgi:hypothetical protein
MATRKVKSGDILQIPLPNELGFAYAKLINLLEIDTNARYPTLINIYNYRSEGLDLPVEDIVGMDLILCPLLVAGILPAINKWGWKVIGNVKPKDVDLQIPDYKLGEPEENPNNWYYLKDADISKKIKSQYGKVKHLETIGAKGSELINTKIAMALLRNEGKNLEEYFKLEQYFEKKYYQEVMDIEPYYKQPIEIRGKAIR